MAKALTALKRIQISNPENTPGTAEAAIEILYGTVSGSYADKNIATPEQDRNRLSMHNSDDFVIGREAELEIEGFLNSRHVIWMLANSIRGNVTPTQPDATNEPLAYQWIFEPDLTGGNTPDLTNGIDTFTIEMGDNIQSYETEYCFATSLEITASANEQVEFTWSITGAQITETTLTAALTEQTVQYFPANLVNFYIDDSYANLGTTEKSDTLMNWTWTYETQFTPRYSASSTLLFSGVNEDKKSTQLEMDYYRDATSELEKDKYDARTTTYIRIAITGATEIDSGQSNPPHVWLDGAFRYSEWDEADDEDGIQVEGVTAMSQYDPTGAKEITVTVLTDLDDYPV
jgi:hypothetical protein